MGAERPAGENHDRQEPRHSRRPAARRAGARGPALNAALERRLLQGAIAVASLVPLAAGLAGIAESGAMLSGVEPPLPRDLDSHFRYLSGLLFGIGAGFLWCALRIEARGALFRALGLIVVCGGLARLLSLGEAGTPGPGHVFGLAMELGAVPLLLLWQARVARRFRRAQSGMTS